MMNKTSKRLSALVIAGSILALASGAAQALTWHDEPIMGSFVDATVPGQFTVTVNGNPVLIPDSNALPSQGVFSYNPTTCCSGGFLYDPDVSVYAASAVNIDLASDYAYEGHWTYLGPNQPTYTIDFPTNIWLGSWGFPIAELYSSLTDFWTTDAGAWAYTEIWTGTAGADAGVSITSSRAFCLDDGSPGVCPAAVPEPATLALLGLGLAGLGFGRRKRA